MTKHTPAPWKRLDTKDHPAGYSLINIGGSDGSAVAIARTWLNRPDVETLEANARLIAAAPDLLAALTTYHNAIMAGRDPDKAMIERAKDALAKVR